MSIGLLADIMRAGGIMELSREDFIRNPRKLKFMFLHITNKTQGYLPWKMLQGKYLIISVHPFGLTIQDQEEKLCSITWTHTKDDWLVSPVAKSKI